MPLMRKAKLFNWSTAYNKKKNKGNRNIFWTGKIKLSSKAN